VIAKAPRVVDHLCEKCARDYKEVKKILTRANVKFREKTDLVRGLDYYTNTVFEVVHSALGAQDAIAAGGRYDDLTRQMGGPAVGATGYALGVERLLLAVDKNEIRFSLPEILVVSVDEASRQEAFDVANRLRSRGMSCEMDLSGRSLKAQMRKANKEGRKYIIMIGEEERKSGTLLLKNMETGGQENLAYEEVLDRMEAERAKA
jgi:histidyl-tRNA synthetase